MRIARLEPLHQSRAELQYSCDILIIATVVDYCDNNSIQSYCRDNIRFVHDLSKT